MGILSADNNISYTANNACRIYIIKQIEFKDISEFEKNYIDYINNQNSALKSILNKVNPTQVSDIKLIPLITYSALYNNTNYYEPLYFNSDAPDCPVFENGSKSDRLWFYSPLFALRNCPLLDFGKPAYVFQIDGQLNTGLGDVVSFNTSFSVNGQSSCEITLNNRDFKYNFKYFDDDDKYKWHLKPFFDTNDIIIVRYQKKNTNKDSLLNSFKKTRIDLVEDVYRDSENDPFITLFTGYINDINSSFSYSNGLQTMSIVCTGPSKKLTWTRIVNNQAAASRDSGSALLPISAFINPITFDGSGKVSVENKDVIKNVLVRSMSGVLNIPAVKEAHDNFIINFDKNANILTDKEYKTLLEKVLGAKTKAQEKKAQKEVNEYRSKLTKSINEFREKYNNTIKENIKLFIEETDNTILIYKNSFINDEKFIRTPLFEINGTKQPAYQYTFQNFNSLFQSTFSTVYQFIKGIADNIQFNFYDDPYGIIHFGIPNLTLAHLQNGVHPNNINQLTTFTETQNTENIANIQYASAKPVYDLDMSMINMVVKDYPSIIKYGERMMQPFERIGVTDEASIKYNARMLMTKYNRKALSSIRINIVGEPGLKLDKYAYFKPLRKLFYIESYSHTYQAGSNFSTSVNGTYTREILAKAEYKYDWLADLAIIDKQLDEQKKKEQNKNIIQKLLLNTNSVKDVSNVLDNIKLSNKEILNQEIYNAYVNTFGYPVNDEGLRLEINAMYTPDNVKQCFLDGFFWAIPFDADPYSTFLGLKEQEKQNTKKLEKTETVRRTVKNNIQKENKKQGDLNYCPTAQSIIKDVDILQKDYELREKIDPIYRNQKKMKEKLNPNPSLLDLRSQVNKIFVDVSYYRQKNLQTNKEFDEKRKGK